MRTRAEKICLRFGIFSLASTLLLFAVYTPVFLYSPMYQPYTPEEKPLLYAKTQREGMVPVLEVNTKREGMVPVLEVDTKREGMVHGWEENISRDTLQYVQPDNVTTIINIHNLCSTNLFLVVIVCSAPANFDQRSAIRDTWASLADDSTRVTFLLGQTNNSNLQNRILEESAMNDDIIQEGFLDSYNNLTIKSVMMLKWLLQQCTSARFIMKSDDDTYVNLPALSKALQPTRENLLVGYLICKAEPDRNSTSKWYTPRYIFSERFFPNYLSGSGYVMSQEVVLKLYKAALSTPIIHLEDVYITGICARVAGVTPLYHYSFYYERRDPSASCNPTVFTNHRMSPEDLRTAFSHINNCSTATPHYRSKHPPAFIAKCQNS